MTPPTTKRLSTAAVCAVTTPAATKSPSPTKQPPEGRPPQPLLRSQKTYNACALLAIQLLIAGCHKPQEPTSSQKIVAKKNISTKNISTSKDTLQAANSTAQANSKANADSTTSSSAIKDSKNFDLADVADLPREIVGPARSCPNSADFIAARTDDSFNISHTASGGVVKNKAGKVLLQLRDMRRDDLRQVDVLNSVGQLLFRAKISTFNHIAIQDSKGKDIYLLRLDGSNNTIQIENQAGKYLMESCPYGAGLAVCQFDSKYVKYHVFERNGKMVLLDKKDKPVLSCKEKVPFMAMTCFGLDDIDKKIQYTLAYTLMFMKL